MHENHRGHALLANLKDYWNQRAPYYNQDTDVAGRFILKSYIEQAKPVSIIEIGCGTGILFKYYAGIPCATACDFSTEMLAIAGRRIKRHEYPIKLLLRDIILNPPQGKWDAVVTRTVLMHIRPEDIAVAVQNITRICSQALIFEWWQAGKPVDVSPHCFLHNYVRLFKKHGFKLQDSFHRSDTEQVLFWFVKR